MRHRIVVGTILVLLSIVWIPASGAIAAEAAPGAEIGPVAGVVRLDDGSDSLAVRSGPSQESRLLDRVKAGSRVTCYKEFRSGWVKLRTPVEGGWARIEAIKPSGGKGIVTEGGTAADGLRVFSAPSKDSYGVRRLSKGTQVSLTGRWSQDGWAEISSPTPGWVKGANIKTSLSPDYPSASAMARQDPDPGFPNVQYGSQSDSKQSAAPKRLEPPESPQYEKRREDKKRRAYRRRPPKRQRSQPVHVNAGPVGVHVGPQGGWSVNVGGIAIGGGPRGGVGVRVGP